MKLLRAATRDTFRSFQFRNFRLFFTGQIISLVGNWLTLVAQTLLVLKLTDSGIALGGLAAAQFGPVLLLGPWAGLIADRSDKRKLLLIVQTIAMGQSFVLAALAFSGHPAVWAVYAVALVGGMTIAFDNPARRSFVVEMVPEDAVSNAVSLNSALMTSSRVVGPALAGLLVVTAGFGWAFLLDGLSYTAVLAGLWMMRTGELRRPPVTARARGQVREGLRYARSVPELWLPLAMMALVGTLSYNFQTVFPLFITRDLHGSGATFTLLFSVVSVGALVGALATARRQRISIRAVAVSALAYGAALAFMAVAPNQAVAFTVAPLLGLASIAFLTASTAIVQIEAAPEMRGRILALQAMLFLGSTPIGGPTVGYVSEQFGARYGIGIGAAAALVAGSVGFIFDRRNRALTIASPEVDVTVLDGVGELAIPSARAAS
jgi:MFS family permease